VGAAVDAVENQNGAVYAGFSKLDSLFRQGNAKAIYAFGLKPPGNWNHAVPVGVRLDDRENLPPRRRILHYA